MSRWPTERFEEYRAHLHAAGCRTLRSPSEANDAVQEASLRSFTLTPAGAELKIL
jgi:DNA-directed RNA polymerase specialized sigma24 family protein